MPLQSTISKILVAVLGFIIFLLAIDIIFFASRNILTVIDAIRAAFEMDPLVNWGITIFIISIIALITIGLFYRRRNFLQRLKRHLDDTERVTLVELARELDITPAKLEIEINKMISSKVYRIGGLLIISQGRHIYIGEALLEQIIALYEQQHTRGEIAGSLQILRDEIDKVISYLINQGIIEEREERQPEKLRPSYRRGTR